MVGFHRRGDRAIPDYPPRREACKWSGGAADSPRTNWTHREYVAAPSHSIARGPVARVGDRRKDIRSLAPATPLRMNRGPLLRSLEPSAL